MGADLVQGRCQVVHKVSPKDFPSEKGGCYCESFWKDRRDNGMCQTVVRDVDMQWFEL
jgi:hypothetical protein